MAQAGPALAHSVATDAEIAKILGFVSKELAVPLSALSKRFGLSEDQMGRKLESLTSRGLLRVQGILGSSDAVYSITQDGARKIESL